MAKKRNYKLEYERDHATPEAKKERASRNRARAEMKKAGRVRKGDGKEVDHKNMNPLDNSKGNLQVVPRSVNRRKQPKRK